MRRPFTEVGWPRRGIFTAAWSTSEGLRVVIEETGPDRHGPQPVVYFEPGWRGPSPAEIRQRLLDGDPPIYVGMGHYADEINLVMVCLQDGEEEIVAERLLEILHTA